MFATALTPPPVAAVWTPVCPLADIIPDSGVAALVGRRQIAVIRRRAAGGSESVHALSNYDPFSEAFVISRGIVGDAGGVAFIASPIYKQRFRLDDGRCLDDASVALPTYPVRIVDGVVQVQAAPAG
jgi:nitrite reductase (NADH) small subunit